MKIFLDNGHGSDTAGKRSPVWDDGSQLFEWKFNREIVYRIKEAIPECLILTPESTDVPLPIRVLRMNRWAQQWGRKNCLLISIHANAGGGTGWEAFTSVGTTDSDKYAKILCNEAEKLLVDKSFKMRKGNGSDGKEAPFYILKHTICPAVLTENLFMDNEIDCRFLMSEYGKQTIAQLHINAINKILKK